MNHFCFVGIYAVLAMLMLMIMPSSIADELEIKVEGDKNATVYVKKTDKVSTVKQKIVEKLRENIDKEIGIIETELKEIKENKIMTFIRTNLKVSNKRIDELKANLEEKKNEKNKILTARKTLRLDKNDSPLEDSKTMKECGIVKKGATVFLALEGFEISIQYTGKKYTIWVNNEDTVYELKEKIEKVIGIHHSEQKLTFQAENDIVLEDNEKTMQFYNIGKGASLLLKREFRIGCQYKFKEYFPIVEETEKVSSVKEKVKEMINDEILKEKVKEMINDEILKEMVKKEIKENSSVKEKVKEMINDEILKEKVKKEIKENSSVKEKVKKEIKEKSDILLNNIALSYWGKELKDDAEIGSYYRIDSKSAIVGVYELEQSHDDETTTTSPLLND